MSDIGKYYVLLQIDDKKCDYCLECTIVCPSGALTFDHCFEHDPNECMYCESCEQICEQDAIMIRREE